MRWQMLEYPVPVKTMSVHAVGSVCQIYLLLKRLGIVCDMESTQFDTQEADISWFQCNKNAKKSVLTFYILVNQKIL